MCGALTNLMRMMKIVRAMKNEEIRLRVMDGRDVLVSGPPCYHKTKQVTAAPELLTWEGSQRTSKQYKGKDLSGVLQT